MNGNKGRSPHLCALVLLGPPRPRTSLELLSFSYVALPGLPTQLGVGVGTQPLVQMQGRAYWAPRSGTGHCLTSFPGSASPVPTPSPHPQHHSGKTNLRRKQTPDSQHRRSSNNRQRQHTAPPQSWACTDCQSNVLPHSLVALNPSHPIPT